MIYCVAFSDVDHHLRSLGLSYVETRDGICIYEKGDEDFAIREPNVNGDLPEMIVNDALNGAGLPVPSWTVRWCD